jgi:LCP family protein required for cell wall assembly
MARILPWQGHAHVPKWSGGMTYPRRRLVIGALVATLLIIAVPSIWLGAQWKRALNNVDKMIVSPVALPTVAAPAVLNQTPHEVGPNSGPAAVPEPAPTSVPAPDGTMNILLLGTDARPGDKVSRTDTMVLLHIDGSASRVSMLSFPRDLLVTIPGYGKNRINSAYLTGEQQIGAGYGPALVKQTVGELVGLQVTHFVMVNFDGFTTLIDKLGGIYVDVPKPIDDPAYPTENYGTIKVHFDAGRQLLNGERALIYSRTRHADSDFGRNQRQQQVLLAIFDRVREQGLLGQLTNLDEYTDVMSDYIRTDLSRRDMLSLASMGANLDAGSIQRYAIDPSMVVERRQPGYVLVLSDTKAFKRLINQMLDPTIASAGGENPSR